MKRIIILLLMLPVSGYIMAQSIRPSNPLLEPYTINPASVDKYYSYLKAGVQYRNQWINFEGAPTTYSAFATGYIPSIWSQFGGHFLKDKIGYTHAMDFGLSYALSLTLSESNNKPLWILNLGLRGHLQNFYYDTNDLVFEEESMRNDLSFTNIYENVWSPDFDFGVETSFVSDGGKEWMKEHILTVGFSAQNMIACRKENLTLFSNTNFIYTMFDSRPFGNKNVKHGFGLNYSYIFSNNQYAREKQSSWVRQWEANVKWRLYSGNGEWLISPGLLFRRKKDLVSISDFGGILECEWKRTITVSLAYEQLLTPMGRAAHVAGTFEVILIVRPFSMTTMPYNKKSARNDDIICGLKDQKTDPFSYLDRKEKK